MRNSLRQAASSEAPAAPETTMLLRVITHTPFCIWLLLAGLVALGWKQSRDQLVGPLLVVARPALLVDLGSGLSIGHCVGHCARLLRMTRQPRRPIATATATMSAHA